MQSKLLALLQPDDQSRAGEALSDEVVFHSPVRDYHGRADVAHLVSTIAGVVNEIIAEREFAADREIVTIITASHGGRLMDGVLYETHDTAGRIERATLLLRPLSTLRQAIAEMGRRARAVTAAEQTMSAQLRAAARSPSDVDPSESASENATAGRR